MKHRFYLTSGSFECGKMDSYSGSTPRKFIPFRLGKESNDQPQQTPV